MQKYLLSAFLAVTAVWLMQGQQRSGKPDYMPSDLRAKVEALKISVQTPVQDIAEVSRRLRVLWDWGNAYALSGGPIPVDFPSGVSQGFRALKAEQTGGRNVVKQVSDFIARYTWAFQVKDEMPAALGKLELSSRGPFRANSFLTVRQTYTVGEMPVQTNGGFVITISRGGMGMQTKNPSGEGYISVRSTNPNVRLEEVEPWANWTSFIARDVAAYRVKAGTLVKGDQVIFTYGDTSGGGNGMRAQAYSNDRVILPLLIDPNGKGRALTPDWPSYEVVGEQGAKVVNAVAPSVVRTGETFTLSVRTEDGIRNLSSGPNPGYSILLNGKRTGQIAKGGNALAVVDGLKIDTPGVYRFTVHSDDGVLRGESNPVWVQTKPAYLFIGVTPTATQDSPKAKARPTVTSSSAGMWPGLIFWSSPNMISGWTIGSGRHCRIPP